MSADVKKELETKLKSEENDSLSIPPLYRQTHFAIQNSELGSQLENYFTNLVAIPAMTQTPIDVEELQKMAAKTASDMADQLKRFARHKSK